ncbi:MAG: SMP-30/gluconolactonase/LRE family protein [Gemmatimonadota bacterium]|nr:SMP-30/gluconolactonase/LRE family protein [Gemmatimonadota bacterium]
MKLKKLIESDEAEQLATGFQFTEGPVWMSDRYLLFSDIPGNRINKWTEGGGIEVWRDPSGNGNGLTHDHNGLLLACEHGNRRVSRTDADGTVTTLADTYQEKRLNSPNDIVVKSDGTVYFTDPPYGIQPEQKEQAHNGVYRVLSDGTIELLADDFERPNGLAFSPDESMLYIDDSFHRHLRAFDVNKDGTLANSRIITDMDHPQPGSPDGMKVDEEGHVYITGPPGIWVLEPDGAVLGIFCPPELPANLAWGDDDRCSLYITARTSLYRIRVSVPGMPVVSDRKEY